ncbi:MAG: cupin domain-containing protein [Actinomycetota bacterium]|nr:cupin domain-containing protein [Actinomycetota bacterium]
MRSVSIAGPPFTYDDQDPEGFRAGMFRPGPGFGAKDSGATLYELPPGQAICPYHYEYGEEEWLLVVAGRPTIRTPEGSSEAAPDDLVFFPKGPEGAHQVRNDTSETVRVLMWSTIVVPTATAYPDSDKVGVWTGVAGENLMAPRSANVDYYSGERGA